MKPKEISQETLKKTHEAMQKLLKSTEMKMLQNLKDITTEQAFEHLLQSEELWKRTGISPDRQRYFKHLNKEGKKLTLDKKIELLNKAGFQETITWTFTK